MRDRAPVNSKALRTVSILYPNMMDIGCISYFLDCAGTKCVTPAVTSFMSLWNTMLTTSMKARQAFKNITGRGLPRYNANRWWSLWECLKLVFEEWRHVPVFLGSDEEFANASRRRLTDIMQHYPTELRLDMAVLMELERFIKATVHFGRGYWPCFHCLSKAWAA